MLETWETAWAEVWGGLLSWGPLPLCVCEHVCPPSKECRLSLGWVWGGSSRQSGLELAISLHCFVFLDTMI